ncbi:hypothetical protein K438DRAFT_1816989 [Mycena galopus ATCC 62051]|nr:hypothetical protein K438DRAFT_1816989 [Mycena galopus ATCC 62051]
MAAAAESWISAKNSLRGRNILFPAPLEKRLDVRFAENPKTRIVVGVAIFSSVVGRRRLLIVQRAKEEKTLPNRWELPGGKCNLEWDGLPSEVELDRTVLDVVERETREETGLVVERVFSEFDGFKYETKRGWAEQLNFLVQVKGLEPLRPTLNPEEHQAYMWIESLNELKADQMPIDPATGEKKEAMTKEMEEAVEKALEAMNAFRL